MKAKDLRKLNDEELIEKKKELEFGLVKSSSNWGKEKVSKKESGMDIKGYTKSGSKTSLKKEIRKNLARINTILNERKNTLLRKL